MVSDYIRYATSPRLVGISANIGALNKHQFLGRDIGYIDINVENKIRDLLNDYPCDEITAELLSIVYLATTTRANTCPPFILAFVSAGILTNLYRSDASSFDLKRSSIKTRRARSASLVGS